MCGNRSSSAPPVFLNLLKDNGGRRRTGQRANGSLSKPHNHPDPPTHTHDRGADPGADRTPSPCPSPGGRGRLRRGRRQQARGPCWHGYRRRSPPPTVFETDPCIMHKSCGRGLETPPGCVVRFRVAVPATTLQQRRVAPRDSVGIRDTTADTHSPSRRAAHASDHERPRNVMEVQTGGETMNILEYG